MLNEMPDFMCMDIHLYLFQALEMLFTATYLEEKMKELKGRGLQWIQFTPAESSCNSLYNILEAGLGW